MGDPVSWKVIEPGWRVVDAAGEEVGKVKEITGDSNADIFDGLAIDQGVLAKQQYVPSEQVGEIVEGTVTLKLTREEIEGLPEFEEPAEEERILPESSTWYQRLAWWLAGRDR
jgi:hypothetical protein